jgi:hypothetical protein
VIIPLHHSRPLAYAAVMRSAIALNGSFFNTQRILSQRAVNAYYPQLGTRKTVRGCSRLLRRLLSQTQHEKRKSRSGRGDKAAGFAFAR